MDASGLPFCLATGARARLKFHDLQHTWASWHVQSGTPLMVLKELGGWETVQIAPKYAHPDEGHLANYVGVIEFMPHPRDRQ